MLLFLCSCAKKCNFFIVDTTCQNMVVTLHREKQTNTKNDYYYGTKLCNRLSRLWSA